MNLALRSQLVVLWLMLVQGFTLPLELRSAEPSSSYLPNSEIRTTTADLDKQLIAGMVRPVTIAVAEAKKDEASVVFVFERAAFTVRRSSVVRTYVGGASRALLKSSPDYLALTHISGSGPHEWCRISERTTPIELTSHVATLGKQTLSGDDSAYVVAVLLEVLRTDPAALLEVTFLDKKKSEVVALSQVTLADYKIPPAPALHGNIGSLLLVNGVIIVTISHGYLG
jgi:hypothetical protein